MGGNDTKGVAIVTSGTEITSHTADIVINGNAGSGANLSDGVYLRLAQIRSLGSGTDAATISITGTGGSGRHQIRSFHQRSRDRSPLAGWCDHDREGFLREQ
ncbi:MAG: hypothetical protein R3F31_25375 [Verrucomicrobiales bacterium]